MLYERVNKALNWGVKLASLAVTGPATWVVANNLFSDIHNPIMLFLMQAAAVFLIEGVMLSNWLLLEYDKRATSEIKARYGLTALAMYIALLVIAWEHEGPTGLVFRIALLAALMGSGWDTYVYTWSKAMVKADKDISSAPAVKRHQRKLSILDARETLTVAYELSQTQRQVDKQVQLAAINSDKVERLAQLDQDHKQALSTMKNIASKPDKSPDKKPRSKNGGRQRALDKMLDIYRENPGASLREVAAKIGRSHQTVSDYLDMLENDGKVHRNGNIVVLNV